MALVFWVPVGAATVLAILWVLYPLLKRGKSVSAARASYDIQVFKDQLKEIDSDEQRGVITQAEATRVRTEVSRRLLAASKAEGLEAPRHNAPKNATYGLVVVIVLATIFGGLGLYRSWGQPGARDFPYSANLARQAAQNRRPSQAEAEAAIATRNQTNSAGLPNLDTLSQTRANELLAKLTEALKTRPDDLEGHRLLAQNLATAGRFAEAHAAQEDVLRILGDQAKPEDYLDNAAIMINAAEGYVSPEAITALRKVMKTIPESPRARFYAGLALWQNGEPRKAYTVWNQLLKEGPETAPWIPSIRANMDALTAEAQAAAPQAPLAGPSNQQVQDAANMTPAERQDMIRSMVAQLTDRLATDGGSVEEWVRLIGANKVLGETDAAAKAVADAKAAFADNPEALARIEQAANQAAPAQAPAPASTPAPALRGPSQQQVQDAASMTPAERQNLIRSMVAQLTDRLATDGGSVEEWVRLIGANAVLGEVDAAKKALSDAQAAFAGDEAALAQINAAGAKIP